MFAFLRRSTIFTESAGRPRRRTLHSLETPKSENGDSHEIHKTLQAISSNMSESPLTGLKKVAEMPKGSGRCHRPTGAASTLGGGGGGACVRRQSSEVGKLGFSVWGTGNGLE